MDVQVGDWVRVIGVDGTPASIGANPAIGVYRGRGTDGGLMVDCQADPTPDLCWRHGCTLTPVSPEELAAHRLASLQGSL